MEFFTFFTVCNGSVRLQSHPFLDEIQMMGISFHLFFWGGGGGELIREGRLFNNSEVWRGVYSKKYGMVS